MNALDWILVVIRWVHAVAAVAWVGGSIFYIMVLRPSAKRSPLPREARLLMGVEFRSLINTAILALLLTGVVASVARLTEDSVTIPYVAVLAVKIVLAMYMFYIVRFLRPTTYPDEEEAGNSWWEKARAGFTGTTAVLVIGLIVFGLADVLSALFEQGLRG